MSAAIFRAAEILDMALQIERQGIAFYSACRDMAHSPGLIKTFSFLIGQEHRHADIFSGMKAEAGEQRLPEGFAGEYESTVDSFVRGRVFSSPEAAEREARRLRDEHTAVDRAVEFEQQSISFYNTIKDRVRDSEAAVIERVIDEERSHIERLNRLRRDLNGAP